ncbi:MAG: MoxR family ATPase [Bacteroidia bacterium]|nr:MoxR family ATPase [Bacteroidia bacterium]MDW8333670.1 MoxR family ATPase [Bacteroidia bacterium]
MSDYFREGERPTLRAWEERLEPLARKVEALSAEIERVVVGQKTMVHRLLIGLFTGGHVLLEGAPGLAKTLTVSTLAKALGLRFKRIQFTPDLLPTDLIGTLIYNPRDGRFEVKTGPVFANIVLADEINRSPAKVQSALLEAMQERQVTLGDETYPLPAPFLVLATQNPIDQQGTYPLPEAQLDRFMLKVHVDYPTRDEELKILRMSAREPYEVRPLLSANDVMEIRSLVRTVHLSERLENYIVDLVGATRRPEDYKMPELKKYLEFGASPRATIALAVASRACAFIACRSHVVPDDVKSLAADVLNHRVILRYEAEADGLDARKIIRLIMDKLPI